jgi:hypothetical protein
MENEVDKFFGDLPSQDKPADSILEDKPTTTEPEKGEEEVEEPKNRTERRLREKLQRERESNIALNARIQALAEVDRTLKEPTNSEMPAEWIALYGTTPESEKAWKIQEKMMQDYASAAEERALERFREEQGKVYEEQQQFETEIGSELESIEEDYNVDLTSNTASAKKSRTEFLDLVKALSPKDDQGYLTGYADFGSTFEIYQQTRQKADNSRQRELASRAMQDSGKVNTSKEDMDAQERWLNEHGIKTRN